MKLIGKVICFFKGHKRGRQSRPVAQGDTWIYFACPRCGRETRYKIKDQNKGTPGDQA